MASPPTKLNPALSKVISIVGIRAFWYTDPIPTFGFPASRLMGRVSPFEACHVLSGASLASLTPVLNIGVLVTSAPSNVVVAVTSSYFPVE